LGRRSRKRSAPGERDAARAADRASPASAPAPAPPPPRRRRSRLEDVPPAPWGSFPLSELCVLVGLVLLVVGFVTGGNRGGVAIACGLALASLAGLEVSIREHFAGFRSHTLVLALAPAVLVIVILFFARAPLGVEVAAAVVVFLLAIRGLREVFRRRSGGLSFR
jgi:hypothetical protein